jgi:hypothetical protein
MLGLKEMNKFSLVGSLVIWLLIDWACLHYMGRTVGLTVDIAGTIMAFGGGLFFFDNGKHTREEIFWASVMGAGVWPAMILLLLGTGFGRLARTYP